MTLAEHDIAFLESSLTRQERFSTPGAFDAEVGPRGEFASPTHTIEYDLADGFLQIDIEGDVPSWVCDTASALAELTWLEAGWDSYGAVPVRPIEVVAMLQLLSDVLDSDFPRPAVVPTARGGVQVEWELGGVELEVESLSATRFALLFHDLATGDEQEGEFTTDRTLLSQCVASIKQRLSSRTS